MTGASLLIFAILLDAIFGEPGWLWSRVPHPAVLMGRLIKALDERFNHGMRKRLNGFLCTVFLVVSGAIIGSVLSALGPLFSVLVAAVLLAQRSLVEHVQAVATGLRETLSEGRKHVALIVSRDTQQMDETQIARAAIESAAENLSDGFVAPAFWFLIAGLPGLIIYKLVNTADSMIGYKTPKYQDFGWAAARLDDLLNLIPARLTSALIAVVSGVTDYRALRADAGLHRSPNAGWPEAAMSRALGVALSGPRRYHGELREFPWVNESGRRRLSAVDIDACIGMLWKSWGLFLALCFLLALLA